ncbi:NAD-dependent epimerase/dehydratase family protein [Schaedlerella arabinosiphila]|uniref:NAD-dependent epimerase/dehydratase family protein n=1 Tax=Schaedlerella arabinosiphila TaxID=2044587 RepID=A0A3R8L0E4_9FIRM|nr:GDP-mannose 4,6-dehydratase [Schaedlerella arabinosiphila]RRK33726.1 NAD-dependent epimerase/dehydratase family protein [Schaedlerella arabinosiphila]
MKVLITGSSGFIGSHLTAEFEANRYEVIRCDLDSSDGTTLMDIMNLEMIQSVLEERKPDVIVNMAGQADVGLSWKKPQFTVQLNTIGLMNILEAVKNVRSKIRVIAVGSSDEYGCLEERGANVTEDMLVKPITPYAISKLAQELFAQLYVRSYGMDICMIRLFNLGGFGQTKGYLISDFASGVAEVEAGKKEYLSVGNLESARDFTHVKDACRAVRLIAEKGCAGEIYNICSGTTYKAQEILDKLIDMAKVKIDVKQDSERMRLCDTPVVCGNHDKLTAHTGWMPKLGLEQILADALNYWRDKIWCGSRCVD